MTAKIYQFTDDSYYTSNGCDCCEDDYWECYNSEDVLCRLGSASSEDECYFHVYITEFPDNEEWLYEKIDKDHVGALKYVLDSLNAIGVEVKIEGYV